jgi:hypothetical protein
MKYKKYSISKKKQENKGEYDIIVPPHPPLPPPDREIHLFGFSRRKKD